MNDRVSTVNAFFLLTTAVLFDAAQFFLNFIPVIGQVGSMFIAFLALCLFGVWFLVCGVNYFGGRKVGLKIAAVFGTTVAELIPIIDALPAITIGVLTVILATWAEDRENKQDALRQAQKLASISRMKYDRAEAEARRRAERMKLAQEASDPEDSDYRDAVPT